MSVIGVVMISSPGSGIDRGDGGVDGRRTRRRQRGERRAEQLAKRFSKRCTIVPLVQFSVPDSMTCFSRSSSS